MRKHSSPLEKYTNKLKTTHKQNVYSELKKVDNHSMWSSIYIMTFKKVFNLYYEFDFCFVLLLRILNCIYIKRLWPQLSMAIVCINNVDACQP